MNSVDLDIRLKRTLPFMVVVRALAACPWLVSGPTMRLLDRTLGYVTAEYRETPSGRWSPMPDLRLGLPEMLRRAEGGRG